nr:10 kda calcium-binding protein peptide T-21 [rabbits, lung, Peptide Partial, 7 aa] [Oryctolagus cuniculus]
ELTIGSK